MNPAPVIVCPSCERPLYRWAGKVDGEGRPEVGSWLAFGDFYRPLCEPDDHLSCAAANAINAGAPANSPCCRARWYRMGSIRLATGWWPFDPEWSE